MTDFKKGGMPKRQRQRNEEEKDIRMVWQR